MVTHIHKQVQTINIYKLPKRLYLQRKHLLPCFRAKEVDEVETQRFIKLSLKHVVIIVLFYYQLLLLIPYCLIFKQELTKLLNLCSMQVQKTHTYIYLQGLVLSMISGIHRGVLEHICRKLRWTTVHKQYPYSGKWRVGLVSFLIMYIHSYKLVIYTQCAQLSDIFQTRDKFLKAEPIFAMYDSDVISYHRYNKRNSS